MNLLRKSVASIALSTMVVAMAAPGVSAYSDASYEAAAALAAQGIINMQDSAAGYNLGQNVLRQEIAKVAANIAGLTPNATCAGQFMDVSATTPNDWACGYVEALLGEGLISANAYFNPESNITKAEAVKMMLEAAGFTGIYTDVNNWQEEVVAFAVENGVLASAFTDYNAFATRGFVFEQGNASIEVLSNEDDEDILGDLLANLSDMDEDAEADTEADAEAEADADTEADTEADADVAGEAILTAELSPESPANGNVAAGVSRTALLAFTVTAGSEDVTLKQATLDYTGLSDSNNIDDVSIYMGNDKVSKTRNFSDNDLDLDFDKNVVVEAGQTVTLTVTATIQGGTVNESHQITLTNLDASVEVIGDNIVGPTLTPVEVSNKASLKVNADRATDTATIGETIKLAGFELEETEDNEDVLVKSLTFTVEGGIDAEDDLTNLVLTADGVEVGGDLMVNSDDEIIVDLDLTIPQDEKVEFELKGTIIGSVGQDIDVVFKSNDDIYAVGKTTGVNVSFDTATEAADADISSTRTIEGSEINVSFDKSDIDEAKPDAEDVLVGTLNLLATTDDYEIKTITVDVTSTTGLTDAEIVAAVEELELDGTTFDSVDGTTYTFEDIVLSAGEQLELPLTFTVADDYSLNGNTLNFDMNITKVEDTEENDTYTVGGTYDVATILSSTGLDDKNIDIESASFTMTDVDVIDRDLVLGDGIETVVYKAKISIGDADAVTINDFNLKLSSTHSIVDDNGDNVDLDKVVDSATLTVGGSTFDADIDADSIDFSPNAEIAAGSDNVEVLVTVVLKDNDSVVNGSILSLMFDTATVDLEDTDNEDLVAANINVANANDKITETNLLDHGNFDINVIQNSDNTNDIENVVLAGESTVALAEIEIQAEHEDMDVKSLKFNIPASVTGANPALTATLTEVTAGSPATPDGYTGGDEKTFTVSDTLETGDTIYLTYGGTNVDPDGSVANETFSIDVSSTHTAAMEALATALEDKAEVLSATVSGNTITIKGYNNTVEDIASRMAAAIDAKAGYSATVAGDVITVTDDVAADRADTVDAGDQAGVGVTVATTTQGVDAVAAVKTLTASADFVAGDVITVDIDGVTLTQAFDTDNDTTIAALATKIAGEAGIASAVVTDNGASDHEIVITAAVAGTDFTIANATEDTNGTTTFTTATTTANVVAVAEVTTITVDSVATSYDASLDVNYTSADSAQIVVDNIKTFTLSYPGVSGTKTASVATVQTSVSTNDVTTLTVESAGGVAMQAGDSVSVVVEGKTYTAGNLTDLATAINADHAGVAGVVGNVLTITKVAAPFAVSDLTATAKAGTVTGDFSDTLNNVRLVDGNGSIIADGATVTYNPTDTRTEIEFEDFTVTDSSTTQDILLVADIEKYTTNGDETSAALGTINVTLNTTFDVEGANSNDTIVVGHTHSITSEDVVIVPVFVSVSVDNTLGNNDQYAKIQFTIDKGNNVLDQDQVKITSLKVESDTNMALRDDDGNQILAAGVIAANTATALTTNNDIVSGDMFEFKATDAHDPLIDSEIRIIEDSIKYTVDLDNNGSIDAGETFTIDTSSVVDLGTYSK